MDLAVASSREGKISTINVTDPYSPSYIKAVTDQGGADVLRSVRDIAINKNSGLAFATTIDAVLVIDIKDPYNPKLLNEIKTIPGTTTPIGTNNALTQRDGWVYLASDQNGIRTMDFYTPPLNAVDSSVSINSVNDVTVDLDGYTLGELKVNYTINPPGYVANDVKAILVENGTGIKTVSGSTSGTGNAVFPKGMKLDITKKYEVYIVLNCNPPNTKVSERKEVKVNVTASCKERVDGVLVNLPDGSRSTDGGSCCFGGDLQKMNPITELDKCQNRVHNTTWKWEYDGCSLSSILTIGSDVNNPAEGFDTQFSSAKCRDSITEAEKEANCGTLPCDKHDKCYQTCASDLDAGQLFCDNQMDADMRHVCSTSAEDDDIIINCHAFANQYYLGLRTFGKVFAYIGRQKEVCNCCN